MTRPDLDAIERRVTDMDAEEDAWRAQLHFAKNARADVLTLLTYCRELAAENKRLSSYNSKIDQWIEKWTFPGGIYDDAPAPPKTGPWPGKQQ